MANEIEFMTRCVLNNGILTNERWDHGSRTLTQTNQLIYRNVVTVTTADTVVDKGGVTVTNQGICGLLNLTSGFYVNWGPESAGALVTDQKLTYNEAYLIRLAPTVVHRWQAVGGSCKVLIWIIGT